MIKKAVLRFSHEQFRCCGSVASVHAEVAAVDVAGVTTILSGGGYHSHVFQHTQVVAHLGKVPQL